MMKKLVAIFSVATLTLIIFEAVSWLFLTSSWNTRNKQLALMAELDPYEIIDTEHSYHWRLRPGYSVTLEEAIRDKRKSGKNAAVEYLEQVTKRVNVASDTEIFRVNSRGFKGPELDHSHQKLRLLALGDSCTFGFIDYFSYPRTLERELTESGLNIEVVNGGVEGYSVGNLLLRLNEYKALTPNVTTIYIGWNNIFHEGMWRTRLSDYVQRTYTAQLLRSGAKGIQALFVDKAALTQGYLFKTARPNMAEIEELNDATNSPPFGDGILKLASALRSSGSKIAIFTLPGLFRTQEIPSERALRIGHLPAFTDNPYLLAHMSERFNEWLRALAHKENFFLVDLERWSEEALRPRDQFFFDSVHLYEQGQEKIGEFLAVNLAPLFAE